MCADIYQKQQDGRNALVQVRRMRKYAPDAKRRQHAEQVLQQLKQHQEMMRKQRQEAAINNE